MSAILVGRRDLDEGVSKLHFWERRVVALIRIARPRYLCLG